MDKNLYLDLNLNNHYIKQGKVTTESINDSESIINKSYLDTNSGMKDIEIQVDSYEIPSNSAVRYTNLVTNQNISFTLEPPSNLSIINQYLISFNTGEFTGNINLPEFLHYDDELVIESNKHYTIMISYENNQFYCDWKSYDYSIPDIGSFRILNEDPDITIELVNNQGLTYSKIPIPIVINIEYNMDLFEIKYNVGDDISYDVSDLGIDLSEHGYIDSITCTPNTLFESEVVFVGFD